MKRTEKQFKRYMEEHLRFPDCYEETAAKLNLSKRKEEKFMKKKTLICLLSGTLVAACALTLVFWPKNKSGDDAHAMVSIDVNPSIELVLDKKNKVISVYGGNDEGKMIVQGEDFIGKTLDEALEIIVKVESETGYLIEGSASVDTNKISVSVTAENQNVADLEEKIVASLEDICARYDIDETIEKVEKYTREELEKRAMGCDPTLSAEKAKSLTYVQLLDVISLYHLETAEIFSEQLEELYNSAKAHKIAFTEKESFRAAIGEVDAIYQAFVEGYAKMIDQLKEAGASLDQIRYDTLIDPESDYQKTRSQMVESKNEVIQLRKQVSEIDADSPSLTLLKKELELKEQALDAAIGTLTSLQTTANDSIDAAQTILNGIIDSLETLEASFPKEISSLIEKKAKETESTLNAAKDAFFDEFEKQYADDLLRFKTEAENRKAELKNSLN